MDRCYGFCPVCHSGRNDEFASHRIGGTSERIAVVMWTIRVGPPDPLELQVGDDARERDGPRVDEVTRPEAAGFLAADEREDDRPLRPLSPRHRLRNLHHRCRARRIVVGAVEDCIGARLRLGALAAANVVEVRAENDGVLAVAA